MRRLFLAAIAVLCIAVMMVGCGEKNTKALEVTNTNELYRFGVKCSNIGNGEQVWDNGREVFITFRNIDHMPSDQPREVIAKTCEFSDLLQEWQLAFPYKKVTWVTPLSDYYYNGSSSGSILIGWLVHYEIPDSLKSELFMQPTPTRIPDN